MEWKGKMLELHHRTELEYIESSYSRMKLYMLPNRSHQTFISVTQGLPNNKNKGNVYNKIFS